MSDVQFYIFQTRFSPTILWDHLLYFLFPSTFSLVAHLIAFLWKQHLWKMAFLWIACFHLDLQTLEECNASLFKQLTLEKFQLIWHHLFYCEVEEHLHAFFTVMSPITEVPTQKKSAHPLNYIKSKLFI